MGEELPVVRLTCQSRGRWIRSWAGKTAHAAGQLSLRAAATEARCPGPGVRSRKRCDEKPAPQPEGGPRSLQLGNLCTATNTRSTKRKQRNKIKNFKIDEEATVNSENSYELRQFRAEMAVA